MIKKIHYLLAIALLTGLPVISQEVYNFDGTVGSYEKSLTGKGFGAANDVTAELQALIDSVTARPEGGTIILSGEIQIDKVFLNSNVHVNILKGTVIKGDGSTKKAMFDMAVESFEPIENVKFYCGDCDTSAAVNDETEKYIIDITDYQVGDGFRAFMLGNISNFWISDYYIRDNFTKFSSMSLNPVMKELNTDASHKGLWDYEVVASPRKGVVRNAHTENAHTGYGLVQVQCARDVQFEKISGKGGVTLRLESGAGIQFVGTYNGRENGVISGIWAKDVFLENGFSTVTFSPHGRINGDVYLEDIRAKSSAFAIKIATGFFDRELMVDDGDGKYLIDPVKFKKGRFTGPVTIKNVHAEFGMKANGRYGHEYLYVEKSLRDAYPWDSLDYAVGTTKSRVIPSIMAIGYKSIPHAGSVPDTVEGEYLADIVGPVTSEGFPACLNTKYGNVLYEDDKEQIDCNRYKEGYYFDGTVGSYQVSLEGKGFGLENDVTAELQALIDTVSVQPAGGTIILAGEMQLTKVDLRSNVHLNFKKGTVIMGMPGYGPVLFDLAVKSEQNIENVKIYCGDCDRSAASSDPAEKYIFDLTNFEIHERIRAFQLGNVTNFWISDYYVRDNWTKFSSVELNPVLRETGVKSDIHKALRDWEVFASPKKGDIRNSHTENAHSGYGLVQVQCARDVYFEKISGKGGVTLRLESGAGIQFVGTYNERDKGVIKGIRAKDVCLENGFSTVTLSPHGRINEDVFLEDIKSRSCSYAVKIATGFIDGELMVEEAGKKYLVDTVKFKKGRFAGPVIIKNVHAEFGLDATGRKSHEYPYIEKSLRDAYPWDSLSYPVGTEKSRIIPSIMAVGYKSIPHKESVPDTLEGEYLATIDGPVTSEGFPWCLDSIYGNILYEDDKEKINCSMFIDDTTGNNPVDTTNTTPGDTTGTFIPDHTMGQRMYPNPAGDYIIIPHPGKSEISVFNSTGMLVRRFNTGAGNTSRLDISLLPPGIYLVRTRHAAGMNTGKFIRKV